MKRKGFTLIELLVVIGIIAILAGFIIIRIGSISHSAKMSKRISNMNQIKKAIQMFQAEGGSIKPCTGVPSCSRVSMLIESNNNTNFETQNGKYPNNYLSGDKYPIDPETNRNYWLHISMVNGTMAKVFIAIDSYLPYPLPDNTEELKVDL